MGQRRSDAHGSAEIRAEAAAWLARLHAEDRTAADEAAFRRWRTADAAHAGAFDHLTEVWTISGGLAGRPSAADASGLTGGRATSRRGLLAGAAALMAGAAGFGAWETAFAGVYETGVGEQRHVSLSDGTHMFLDTDTKVRARLQSRIRSLMLYRGRASLQIAPDRARPFVVWTEGGGVIAPRGALDLRRDRARLSVVVLQGEATIEPGPLAAGGAEAGQQNEVLAAGGRAVFDETRPPVVDRPDLARLTAWHTGQAMFDDEPLSDAIAEMNRYSTVKLRINDTATARLRISGVYRVGDNVAFARSIARLLPIAVQAQTDTIILTAGGSGAASGA